MATLSLRYNGPVPRQNSYICDFFTMDIKTLCLGLLCRDDASGYDLKKQFESTFKHFYPAGFGSIYPSLADLADRGLITCRSMPQDKRPDRKVYRITDEGRTTFTKALYRAAPEHKLRSEYLVVAYFADYVDDDTLDVMLTDWQRTLDESVSRFDSMSGGGNGLSPRKRFVIGFGKAVTQAMADYIHNHRALLTDIDSASRSRRTESDSVRPAKNIETRP